MAAERLNMALQAASGAGNLSSTITVVDTGGKVVKTSKHLFSAFSEARKAYRARKAEIAEERACQQARRDEARLRAARRHAPSRRLERSGTTNTTALIMDDDEDEEERRQRKREKKGKKKHRSDSSSSSGVGSDMSFEDDSGDSVLVTTSGSRIRKSPSTDTMRTEGTIYSPGCLRGNMSAISLIPEMALAQDPLAQSLQALLSHLQATIDELSCLSAGLAKLISELQKVPDTLAVVAMSLAEAAAMVAKISPAAIIGLKAMFPMIFALLGSPQFAVLAGVGVAATVVVLGGYKIIRNAVAGAPANASVSCEDDDDVMYGEWEEPIEEITREPPQTRMIEEARVHNEGALQRRAIMPPPQEDGAMGALAFDLPSETSASSAAEKDKGHHHHHKHRDGSDKKSKSPKPEKKDKKEKEKGSEKKEKEKGSEKKEKEKNNSRERKSSVSSSASSAPPKEKKSFFSLNSSPASSTTSLSSEKKKKERKPSVSGPSSTTSLSSEKKKERKSSVSSLSSPSPSPPKDKDGKKSKDSFLSLFEGRSA